MSGFASFVKKVVVFAQSPQGKRDFALAVVFGESCYKFLQQIGVV